MNIIPVILTALCLGASAIAIVASIMVANRARVKCKRCNCEFVREFTESLCPECLNKEIMR